jgi:hypothetical protein
LVSCIIAFETWVIARVSHASFAVLFDVIDSSSITVARSVTPKLAAPASTVVDDAHSFASDLARGIVRRCYWTPAARL